MRDLAETWGQGLGALVVATAALGGPAAAAPPTGPPAALSPAGGPSSPALASSCPTFSWAGSSDADGYELVVFRADSPDALASVLPDDGLARVEPDADGLAVALRQRLPAGATSWTPDRRSCLASGARYAWSLRALGKRGAQAGWSEPAWLDVDAAPSAEDIEHALVVLRRHSASIASATEHGSIASAPSFEPLLSPSTGPRAAAAATAPGPGSASLSVSGQVRLDGASAVFKDGQLFLWDGVKQFYGPRGSTAVGRGALASTVSSGYDYSVISNTAVGYRALAATTSGWRNTAVGDSAMRSNTTGFRNTAFGERALYSNEGGSHNTALGAATLFKNVSGVHNTAVGWEALANAYGSRNAAIGYRAGENLGIFGTDNVLIHSKGVASESHALRIGQASGTGSFELDKVFIHGIFGQSVDGVTGTPVFIEATGKLGTTVSSERFKQQIADIGERSGRLLELRPVSFRFRPETGRGDALEFGLIAEEVAEVFPELVIFGDDGKPLSVKYHLMTALLLDLLQEEHRAGTVQREELAALRQRIARLERDGPPARR